ncbi:MAG: DUF1573 domain-containing protein [candidate division Zixibacteria bacterium]|nr:DUF1573 domain-containing protein [candidate division Zixibacteria bacterium]
MKKIILTLVAVLVCSSLVSAQAQLQIPDDSFDFGIVPNNSKSSHTYWLKSVGTDTLKILKVIPGCGCTRVPLRNKTIAPGDSTAFEIIFSSGQRNGKTIKHPAILTNDGTGRRKLTFNADITHTPENTFPLVYKPFKVHVSKAGEVDITSAKFTISNLSEKEISLTLVSVPPGYFSVEFPDNIKAGETVECKLSLTESVLGHAFEKSITFQTNDEAKTRFTLPVVRRIIGSGKS